jgi:C4-dicarboxylate transporter, DctM subunit
MNLFVIHSIWNGKLSDVMTGAIPFHLIMFVLLGLLVLFLDIAMWLPTRRAAVQ